MFVIAKIWDNTNPNQIQCNCKSVTSLIFSDTFGAIDIIMGVNKTTT